MANPIKYNPNGDSKVSGTQIGEWIIADASLGLGPSNSTEYYSQLGDSAIYIYDEEIRGYEYKDSDSKTELINTLAKADRKANGAKEGWVCMVTTSFKFNVPYDQTRITKVAPDGTETILGIYTQGNHTISCEAGYRYIGSHQSDPKKLNPIFMHRNGDNHASSSLGLQGREFGNYSNRGGHGVYYAFALGQGTIRYYEDGDGKFGAPIHEIEVSQYELVEFQATADIVYSYITSTTPIVLTVKEGSSDRIKIPPADKRIFQRRASNSRCLDNTSTGIITSNRLTRIAPDDKKLFATEIADGSGGDACQGLPLSCLSNTYVWPDVLSDYSLVSPYFTQVRIEYYDGGWKLHDQHYLAGTMNTPAGHFVDGNGGTSNTNQDQHTDANAINMSGGAANFRSGATQWRFRANRPFLLVINDNSNDELPLIGWNEDRGQETQTTITDETSTQYTETRPDWLIQ